MSYKSDDDDNASVELCAVNANRCPDVIDDDDERDDAGVADSLCSKQTADDASHRCIAQQKLHCLLAVFIHSICSVL